MDDRQSNDDAALAAATAQIEQARQDPRLQPTVAGFFHDATNTITYVVSDPASAECAIIDSVLDYDAASGRTSHESADRVIEHVRENALAVCWIIETHAHADHVSAAPYIQEQLGGKLAIGAQITQVQSVFGAIFNADDDFSHDGSQFDRLFGDGETFAIGKLSGIALHVPGHTPADMAFVIGNAAFVGDTMFMPDYGTARADFPGGDAGHLYRSIRRLLSLPGETRMFLCHDYMPPERDEYAWETTVTAQRADNVHVHDGVSEKEFVTMRNARDADLSMPTLILPSVQINMRGGHLPEPEANGVSYIKIPVNRL